MRYVNEVELTAAPGCKRETVPGKRVSQCRPTSTWRDEVRRAGRGVVAELKDEL